MHRMVRSINQAGGIVAGELLIRINNAVVLLKIPESAVLFHSAIDIIINQLELQALRQIMILAII